MPQSIDVSDEIFTKLKELAEPFVDTPETVIARLIKCYQRQQGTDDVDELHQRENGQPKIIHLAAENPGSLAHTKMIRAVFDGLTAHKWFDLAKAAHKVAYQYLGSQEAVIQMSGMNVASGKRAVKGFDYVPEIRLSIQRADSNVTWRNVLQLAQQLSLPVHVDFEWRDKDGAAYPGQKGRLAWLPHSQSN